MTKEECNAFYSDLCKVKIKHIKVLKGDSPLECILNGIAEVVELELKNALAEPKRFREPLVIVLLQSVVRYCREASLAYYASFK